jgi:hypothetical protein
MSPGGGESKHIPAIFVGRTSLTPALWEGRTKPGFIGACCGEIERDSAIKGRIVKWQARSRRTEINSTRGQNTTHQEGSNTPRRRRKMQAIESRIAAPHRRRQVLGKRGRQRSMLSQVQSAIIATAKQSSSGPIRSKNQGVRNAIF